MTKLMCACYNSTSMQIKFRNAKSNKKKTKKISKSVTMSHKNGPFYYPLNCSSYFIQTSDLGKAIKLKFGILNIPISSTIARF